MHWLERESLSRSLNIGLYSHLQYKEHAAEAKMDLPSTPTVFMKPQTSLADPWPAPTILPKQTLESDSGDYESELAVVIGKTCKNVSEADALDYVLGYTASNDISCRTAQFAQTQWSYSKGFDGACPIGQSTRSYRNWKTNDLSRANLGFCICHSRSLKANSQRSWERWTSTAIM